MVLFQEARPPARVSSPCNPCKSPSPFPMLFFSPVLSAARIRAYCSEPFLTPVWSGMHTSHQLGGMKPDYGALLDWVEVALGHLLQGTG